jgi:hypothetical protein
MMASTSLLLWTGPKPSVLQEQVTTDTLSDDAALHFKAASRQLHP